MKSGFVPVEVAVGCGCLMVFALGSMVMVGAGVLALNNSAENGSSGALDSGFSTRGSEEGTFLLTHYTPCTADYIKVSGCDPDMQGDAGTANGATAVYDESSPMGYYTVYSGVRYNYNLARSRQANPALELVSGKPTRGVYFDNPKAVFVAMDSFGAKSIVWNSFDIMASNGKYSEFYSRLEDSGLIVNKSANNGYSSATEVRGYITDIVGGGIGGGAG